MSVSVKFYSDDELDSSKENEDTFFKITGRDSVVFAIECCPAMFNGDDSPFFRIINAIYDMSLNKIITSDKDLQAVVLFGTKESLNNGNFSHVYNWQNLDVSCIKSITELKAMQNITSRNFENQYGFSADYQMSDVLWNCGKMFSDSLHKLSSKTLIIFPKDDNPHNNNNNMSKIAKAKAGDLHDNDVEVQVWSFNKYFKYEHFYKEIVSDPEKIEDFAGNPVESIQNLYSFLLRKSSKQRPFSSIPLRLSNGIEMSVGIYTVARRTTKSSAVNIDNKSNKEVKQKTNIVDNRNGDIMMPSDIKLTQNWGGKDIIFSKEEVKKMSKLGENGLTVLGFKSRSKAIKAHYHVHNAQFIYPDERTVSGSTSLFSALLIKCLEKDVVAICSYSPRVNSLPRCVALLPQSEQIDEETREQIKPPGFYIIFLPYADDLRHVEINRDNPKPSNIQIKAAEAMISKLKFSYDPDNIDNPVIQKHYKCLEAMALDKDQPEEFEDHTIPDYNRITRKAGHLIENFKELVYPEGYNPNAKTTKNSVSSGTMNKTGALTEVDIREYVAQNKLGKLTVAGLKEICTNSGIKTTGRKADIIQTIAEHFG